MMAATLRNPFVPERLSWLLCLAAILLSWPVPARAQLDRSKPAVVTHPRLPNYDPGNPVLKKVLKNGVTLLVQEERTSERVGATLALRMGTYYESDDEAGRSQILMKLLPIATTAHSVQDLLLALKAGEITVQTEAGAEQGRLTLSTHREQCEALIDFLAEIALQPSFPDSGFDDVKRACLIAASKETEDPIKATYSMFLEAMYRGSPFHRPVTGTVTGISECRRSDLLDLYHKFFVGGNMVVSLVGNFEGKKMMDRLERRFTAAAAGPAPAPDPGDPIPLSADTTIAIERNYLAQSLVYGFAAPAYTDPDYPAFRVIQSYLTSPDRSPLAFWLPQREIAFNVGALYAPYPKRASLAVYLGATPANWGAARDSVAAVMERLKTEPLDETEWFTHLARVQDVFLFDQNDPTVRSRFMSQYELMGLGYDQLKRIELALIALKPEDVRTAAARWFTHSCTATISPIKSGSKL
jgi:zinc protease